MWTLISCDPRTTIFSSRPERVIFDIKDLFGLSVVASKLGVAFTKCPFTCICVVSAFKIVFVLKNMEVEFGQIYNLAQV